MVPSAFCAKCEFCGNEIDTRAEGSHQYTSGWVKNRIGGGGHGISLAERKNRWACGYCVDRAAKGFLQQGTMF
jgi:hypothetical protein